MLNGNESDEGFVMNMELPEEIATIRENDLLFTQESQQEAANEIQTFQGTKDQEVISVARDGLKLVGNDKESYNRFLNGMKDLVDAERMLLASKQASMDCVEGTSSLQMVETGKSNKRFEKRKKPFYEK